MKWFSPVSSQSKSLDAARTLLVKQRVAGRVKEHAIGIREKELEEANKETARKISHALRSRAYRRRKKLGVVWRPGTPTDKCERALKMRRENKLTSSQIAESLGCDASTVRRWFRKFPEIHKK